MQLLNKEIFTIKKILDYGFRSILMHLLNYILNYFQLLHRYQLDKQIHLIYFLGIPVNNSDIRWL